jgi:hypothetical protein
VGLVYEAGDPSRPRAMGWEQDAPASLLSLDASVIQLAEGSAGVTRVGDIAGYLIWDPTAMTLYIAQDLLSPYVPVTPNANTPNPPSAGTPGTPIILGSGSARVKAG